MRMRNRTQRRAGAAGSLLLAGIAAALCLGFTWPWNVGGPWPSTSREPVRVLENATLEEKLSGEAEAVDSGYRFAVFGDQRALADGEWQGLIAAIRQIEETEDPPLFLVDTGDIVYRGIHSDQFGMLSEILAPVRGLPYLVAVGNHEVYNNRDPAARANTARFLSYLDPGFSPGRMYYRKDVGPVRFLFLDTNDFVYGDNGDQKDPTTPRPGSRGAAQMEWLMRQLADPAPAGIRTTIAVLHHPFVQTSSKHRTEALALWEYGYDGHLLRDVLLDGGVDLVLTGHTHTYERFLLRRDDGKEMRLINISGRPRSGFLWFGAGARRARDVRGDETDWFAEQGWTGMDRWRFVQEDVMPDPERDEFVLFTVAGDGGMTFQVCYLDRDGKGEVERQAPVRVK
jgi:hypothetical protein